MELHVWVECSLDLARHLVGEASGKVASRWIDDGAKLEFARYLAGFRWNGQAMRAVGYGELSAREGACGSSEGALTSYLVWPAGALG